MATERAWPDVAIPPGDVLAEELEARGLTQSRLARLMHRPLQAINEIVRGRKRITGATALELADALGTSAELWIRLEADFELNKARLARRQVGPRRRKGSTSDPRFLKRVAAARRALQAGKGIEAGRPASVTREGQGCLDRRRQGGREARSTPLFQAGDLPGRLAFPSPSISFSSSFAALPSLSCASMALPTELHCRNASSPLPDSGHGAGLFEQERRLSHDPSRAS